MSVSYTHLDVYKRQKYAQPGGEGIEIEVKLELKVIADVGLVGFPKMCIRDSFLPCGSMPFRWMS